MSKSIKVNKDKKNIETKEVKQDKEVKEVVIDYEKPLLKWVGGKTQILKDVLDLFPKEMDSYHELFLGGGSVLLGFLTLVKNKKITVKNKIYAYDLNSALIGLYKNIQTNHLKLYDELKKLIEPYHKLFDKEESESEDEDSEEENDSNEENEVEEVLTPSGYFYEIRNKYNNLTELQKKSLRGSAMFIFLNKTCFRGMYRVGPNGFNVPYGNYKKPEIIDKSHLIRVHNLIKDVEFREGDFKEGFKNIKENDFAYLDPPYAPEAKTSFVKYNKEGFGIENNLELFKLCDGLKDKKIKFLMSNSYVKLVTDAFPENKYFVKQIVCKRSINSKKPGSKTTEVLIKNF